MSATEATEPKQYLDLKTALEWLEQLVGESTVSIWYEMLTAVAPEDRSALVTALVAALKERYNAI